MPKSKPDAAILLQAAVQYFEEELLPTLEGYHRFQTRVAVNVLNTLRRELDQGAANADAEQARLQRLLGRDGDIADLNAALCEEIRSGAIASDDPALRDHVRRSLEEALGINNPKWLTRR